MSNEVWIIERSVNGGSPWRPVTALGAKLTQETADRLARRNNSFHKTCPHPVSSWRDRPMRYVSVDKGDATVGLPA